MRSEFVKGVTVRPLRNGETAAVQAVFDALGPESRLRRFGGAKNSLSPADLELKVVAAVQYAAMAESAATASAVPEPLAATTRADVKPGTPTKSRRWWHPHWTNPLLAALAAAAVTAAAFLGASLFESAPALAATFTLRPQPGQVGSATAVARSVTGGFQIKMDLKHLAKLGPGQFYECVYLGQGGGELVSAGTFLTSNGPVTMQSAANPREFRIIQIRREQPGVDVQDAPVVLTGVADTRS